MLTFLARQIRRQKTFGCEAGDIPIKPAGAIVGVRLAGKRPRPPAVPVCFRDQIPMRSKRISDRRFVDTAGRKNDFTDSFVECRAVVLGIIDGSPRFS
jgi:hypothetical protein